MSVEELLKPRFKVIADFWENPFSMWEILNFNLERGNEYWLNHTTNDEKGISTNSYHINNFAKYPHLFKKLEWWEERKEEDMPEYVKKGYRLYHVSEANEKYPDRFMFDYPMTEHWVQYCDCLPATAEEYNNQKIKV